MTSWSATVPRRRFLALSAALLGAAACSPSAPGAAPTAAPGVAPTVPLAPSAGASPSTAPPSIAPSPSSAAGVPSSVALRPSPSPAQAVGGPPETSEINISYDTPSGPSMFILIVAAAGIPQKYGLTFSTSFVNGPTAVAGLLSGSLNLQEGAGVSSMQAVGSGAPLRILACFQNINTYAIFAGPSVSQVGDLKGKTVAIAERGSNPDVSLRAALLPHGLVVGQDVAELSVGNDPARLAAVLQGNVDAAVLDEGSFGPRAQAQGLHTVLSIQQDQLPWIGNAPVTTTSFLQQNPNTVLAVLKSLIDGARFFQDPSNRNACLAVIADEMSLTPDDPQVALFYTAQTAAMGVFSPVAGATTILGALKSIDPDTYANKNVDDFLDTSFLTQLQSAGFVTLDG